MLTIHFGNREISTDVLLQQNGHVPLTKLDLFHHSIDCHSTTIWFMDSILSTLLILQSVPPLLWIKWPCCDHYLWYWRQYFSGNAKRTRILLDLFTYIFSPNLEIWSHKQKWEVLFLFTSDFVFLDFSSTLTKAAYRDRLSTWYTTTNNLGRLETSLTFDSHELIENSLFSCTSMHSQQSDATKKDYKLA